MQIGDFEDNDEKIYQLTYCSIGNANQIRTLIAIFRIDHTGLVDLHNITNIVFQKFAAILFCGALPSFLSTLFHQFSLRLRSLEKGSG